MQSKSEQKMEQILEFMNEQIAKNGFPPTVREICSAVGLRSTSSVHSYLKALEKSGKIVKHASSSRAISITPSTETKTPSSHDNSTEMIDLPIVGQVAAGQPILATENIQEYFQVPAGFFKFTDGFILQVKGDSMVNVGILNGDYVIVDRKTTVNNGEIAVALIDDSATVKTFYRESDHIVLKPENDYMEPIICKDVSIVGKVVGTLRRFD